MANWIGFDYGKRYIGVAIGNDLTRTANAIRSVTANKGVPDWGMIDQIISDWSPEGFVLGYPLNMDGTAQKMSSHVQLFRKNLQQHYQKPCYLVDERLSTYSAKQQLANQLDKDQLNASAAQIILQHWFDEGMPTDDQFPV